MGKRIKRKARTPAKEKRVVTPSKAVSQQINPSVHTDDSGDSVVKDRKPCTHLSKGFDINKLANKFGSSDPVRCEDCREDVADRRPGKGKHGKKKGSAAVDSKSESKAIWVCLECGHYACGGIGLPTIAQSHVVRHARQTGHTMIIQWDNPLLCWCFPCMTLIPVEKTDGDRENKDILSDFLKLIKGQSSERSPADVEDVWFGAGGVNNGLKSAGTVSNIIEGSGGYVVRGFVNLGNTCFFNSVMQNLLVMNKLREHFLNIDTSLGPLTIALKKLFTETKEAGVKNLINPKSFFACVCSKAPQFRGYQQHDSHELLRCLLNGLYNEEVGARKRISFSQEGFLSKLGPTFVDTVFGGQISSTVCCIECGHSSTVYEPFLDLSLPVPMKKPPAEKAQRASRTKKTKLPPKRSGKIRQKAKRDAEEVATSSVDYTLGCSSGPTPIDDETGSVPQLSASVLGSENQKFQEIASEKVALADDFTWLDFLEPETVSDELELTPQNNDIAMIRDSKENDVLVNDVSQNNEDSSRAGELNIHPGSSGNPWEDEIPMQVQDSEVLLLPYKEESSTAGEIVEGEADAFSSVLGCAQEEVDFDGIGDLFDEPEISTVSTTQHFLGTEVSETGFAVGNSSESDLDEVDDTDALVSVESCLAHFIKPELLSDDNAWDCENCTEHLRQQRLEAKRKQPKTASTTTMNGDETRGQTDQLQLDKDNYCPIEIKTPNDGDGNTHITGDTCSESFVSHIGEIRCWNQNFLNIENSNNGQWNPLVSQCVEGRDEMKEEQKEQLHILGCCKSYNQESSSSSPIISCGIDGLSDTGYSTFQQTSAQLLVEHCETNGSANKEINSESVKVKRDATKRVLINKAPHVLTIHLKRFSQDARGRLSKLNGHVSFRETIDLRPYMDPRNGCKEKRMHRLVGVVEHLGTMRGGHYVAYVQGEKSRGKEKESGGSVWYHASDAYVREVSLEQVLRCEAYILFYEEIRD
ncbi:ubiquitin carboxyl-terminal hydrolase 2 isoform X1 [Tripterygium wilfordii]|uniref:ubiquitinyl hydrolase 1 n=1 Tax=Tripterygium wilfordii TaxID=458696 RepID=A0A7J7CRF5_TRIWF|nr:ubiquitin carboxyl-terminal hydrolase 2-like isoform X1 [Tripterygium wilfordii]XP_038723567.1 ubiquitin carboxyl-terminal hydrolase 2-like isoform X1 [Tripterygium wilfordii]XP_038723568.1 ubiquitin carboxyl-terminal hydrolase 2-like isoform X1 [Tripterygium wilfordii]XP_038723569.1 ubiquitin carboxyl-terminal hydrolase 2-like isoform X1 [Tripterygium wilfordii]KAF5736641.1 ubiquitin carboxyl-terminal hydrolase 2 isoform X1 [Tripterygium wilfordii]